WRPNPPGPGAPAPTPMERCSASMHEEDTGARVPPHDIEAEQAALGGMLLSADAAITVLGLLQRTDFCRPAHQGRHTAISALIDRGEPVDAISLDHELTKRGEPSRTGGAPYLHTLTDAIPTAANAGYYAKIVADRALLRRLTEVGTHAAQIGYTGEGEAIDLVDGAQAEMMAITQTQHQEEDPLPVDYLPRAMDRIE